MSPPCRNVSNTTALSVWGEVHLSAGARPPYRATMSDLHDLEPLPAGAVRTSPSPGVITEPLLPPGPAVEAARQTLRWIGRPFELLDECAARFGDAFTLDLGSQGKFAMFSAPEAIRTIFGADPADAHAGKGHHVLEPLLGARSLLLLEEAAHRRERRLLMPSFQAKRVEAYGDIIRAATNDVIDRLVPDGGVVALHDLMQEVSLHVILRAVFGLGEGRDHAELAAEIQAFLNDRRLNLATLPQLRDGVESESFRTFKRRLARIDALLFAEIERRRARPDPARQDVLSVLLGARYEDGSAPGDAALRDELVTLLMTGYETTATALAWALHWIHADAAVLRRLREEIAGLGPAPAAFAEQAPYLRAVCNETLRIHPILPLVARQLQRPLVVQGYELPAGIHMTACIYLAHRRAATYPEPHCFRPERFLHGEPPPYEFLPFGGGTRRCLGMMLALFEMKLVLGTLLSRCSFEAAGGDVRPVRRSVTISPSDGTRLRVLAVAARPGA